MSQKSPVVDVLSFMRTVPGCCCWHALCLFRFGILPFEIGERYIQRFVTEADADGSAEAAWVIFRVADHPDTEEAQARFLGLVRKNRSECGAKSPDEVFTSGHAGTACKKYGK